MVEIKKSKRLIRRIIYSKISIVVLAIIVFFMFNAMIEGYKTAKNARIERERIEKNLSDLGEREEYLREEIEHLNTEIGIEEEIRSRFNVVKDGEEMVVVVNPISENTNNKQKKANFAGTVDKIKKWFGF